MTYVTIGKGCPFIQPNTIGPQKPVLKNSIMSVLKAGIASLNPDSLLKLTNKLITRMTGNANFADPQPALAAIEAKRDELALLITEAEEGGKRDRVARDICAKELKGMLRILASYVSMTAAGDANIILSSGFGIRNEAEPPTAPTTPAALKAIRSSKSGEVEVDWESVENAASYRVMMTTTDPGSPSTEWTSVAITTRSKAVINNLTMGQLYWFKVQAVGSAGISGYCDPAMVMAA
jgi:hypothetical protein